jgi:hypothetical protein
MNWHELTAEKANEIIEMNKNGKKPMALEEFITEVPKAEKEPFSNVVGQDSLTRFDRPKQTTSKKRRNKSRNKNKLEATVGNVPKNNDKNNAPKKPGNRTPNQNRNRKPTKNE